MRKTNLFLHLILAVGVLFMTLDCTCAMAAPETGIRAKTHAMPLCHMQREKDEKSNPSDCCGKCQIEKYAVLKNSDFSQLASVYKTTASGPALTVDYFSPGEPSFSSTSYLETGPPLYEAPFLVSLSPRAPPAM